MNAREIKEAARRLGFARCGVARVETLPEAADLRAWLADGRHGTMGYMAARVEEREDPRRVVPEARSVISAAMSYAPPKGEAVPEARVARYAQGEDYHEVLGRKLEELCAGIRAGGASAKWWVDTGPVMEKPWAARAGVGWIGKNTNVIHERDGSWLLLGQIVTDLELEPDPTAVDHCGSCTRCLDACPTKALTEPYRIDARLCISYLTIEHRGAIDEPLRGKMGAWVYGCDVCQEVCPWNAEAPPRTEEALAPRPEMTAGLVEWLRLSEEDYRARTKGTSARRAKRNMLRRNAAIALGNSGDPAARPALEEAARDPDPNVAETARWALGKMDRP